MQNWMLFFFLALNVSNWKRVLLSDQVVLANPLLQNFLTNIFFAFIWYKQELVKLYTNCQNKVGDNHDYNSMQYTSVSK